MKQKKSYLTVTDQFCGAGGSSQGAEAAGVEISVALNHWKLAIETHNTNFPNTIHDCTDISACDPRRYPPTDILITSPECTNHSLAKGQKIVKKQMDMFDTGKLDPAAERSRATMWDVCRFAEYHSYNAIIVENVVDARKWVMFDAWLLAMHALGYNHKCVYLNSMHCHPTPQSRDRMYIVFWKKGNKAPELDYTPVAYCGKCEGDVMSIQTWKQHDIRYGKYKQQYVYSCPVCSTVVTPYYYAAFNCIDWSDIGIRIGERKKPLSENTIKRIEYGLKKYGKQSLMVHTAYGKEARGVYRPLTEPSFTQTSFPSQAVVHPYLIQTVNGGEDKHRSKSILDTSFTHTTLQSQGIVTPFLTLNEHTKVEPQVRGAMDAIQTQATRQTMALITPFIPVAKGKSMAHSSLQPLSTQCQMINHGVVTSEAWNSFISYYYGQHQASGINEAIGSATTKERHQLISYNEPSIEDCFYRMLKPKEIKLAMAFGAGYTVLGSGKDQVKQLGNAVTPPAMQWLVGQVKKSFE